jgi:hypothetical protein
MMTSLNTQSECTQSPEEEEEEEEEEEICQHAEHQNEYPDRVHTKP